MNKLDSNYISRKLVGWFHTVENKPFLLVTEDSDRQAGVRAGGVNLRLFKEGGE